MPAMRRIKKIRTKRDLNPLLEERGLVLSCHNFLKWYVLTDKTSLKSVYGFPNLRSVFDFLVSGDSFEEKYNLQMWVLSDLNKKLNETAARTY